MLPTTILTANRQNPGTSHSQRAEAYARIKAKIVTLEMPPASLVDEGQLMDELGLGRTPIREALQQLAAENLVVILPRRGTLVADLNTSDLQKVFEIRLELEPYAARLAALRATPEQIAGLQALLQEARADDLLTSGDHHKLIQLDYRFHRSLARAAHNEFLEDALERLYSHVLRLWHVSLHRVSRLSDAIQEHREIIAAVETRDPGRAAQAMRAHVDGFQTAFVDAISQRSTAGEAGHGAGQHQAQQTRASDHG